MPTWLIVIGVALFLVIVLRSVTNQPGRASRNSWRSLMSTIEVDAALQSIVGSNNFTYAVAKVIEPMGVSYTKFVSNLLLIGRYGSDAQMRLDPNVQEFRMPTPSAQMLLSPTKRPVGWPLWMIAAFPDIAVWANDPNHDDRVELLFEAIDESVLESAMGEGNDSQAMIHVYRQCVENYLRHGPGGLETR
jgi:hypothetical protein